MALARNARGRPLDYYRLLRAHPDGPALGSYAGQPIPEAVVDADGRRYRYAGIAPPLRGRTL